LLEDKLFKNTKESIDKIIIPDEKLDRAINLAIKKGKRKGYRNKKGKSWIYVASAAILFIGLLFGSATISPTMAKVVSEIPFIGKVFADKQNIADLISDKLRENGRLSNVDISYLQKEINIKVQGSEKYFNREKEEIQTTAEYVLAANGYNAYSVKVTREIMEPKDEKVVKESNEFYIIESELMKELEKRNFDVQHIQLYNLPNKIIIEIPTEEDRTREISSVYNEILNENEINHLELEFKEVNIDESKQEAKWIPIIQAINEELLRKKEYKVNKVGFEVNLQPEIQVFLEISGKETGAKTHGEEIEKSIDNFLKSDQLNSIIKNNSYKITIYDKDNKQIN
jgi:hypothetical protein